MTNRQPARDAIPNAPGLNLTTAPKAKDPVVLSYLALRDEYICSWCEIQEGYLLAVPYPNSQCEIRRFPYPREADIVGRVIGVAMRLAESHD